MTFLPAGLAGWAAAALFEATAARLLAGGGIAALVYLVFWAFSEAGRIFCQLLQKRKEPAP